ncbi:MAG: hypothetical protein HeimC3_51080 [Candidatus Heimdallarchaeota archaeon LC_3]|nr:MAG: hypothetical protein HeimC3_51080 [Candidatus Heimdallarchaeota archaeon LC_3]
MRRGGFPRSSMGMSRPFGHRPNYSGRRYMNRSPGMGYRRHSDLDSLCCFLMCLGCMLSDSRSSRRTGYYSNNYNNNYYRNKSSSYTQTATGTSRSTVTEVLGTCSSCGTQMLPKDVFCQNCGYKRK